MDLRPGEHVVFQGRPAWRALLSFYAKGVLAAAVLGAAVGAILSVGTGLAVGLGLLALTLVVGYVRRLFTTYTITNPRLRIRRGIVARRVQETLIERVQNVNYAQGGIDRGFRVGNGDFDTAGTDDSDFTFRGIADPSSVVAAVDRAQRVAAGRL